MNSAKDHMTRDEKNNNVEYVTRSAYEKLLKKRLEIEKKLEEAEKSIGEAVGRQGDWHDNPAYDAAVESVRYWSARLQKINEMLRNVEVVDNIMSSSQVVQIGVRLKVSIDGEEMDIILGGSMEGAVREGVVSYKSPLGQALLGAKEGEVRTYVAPTGTLSVRVEKIYEETDSDG